MSMQIVNELQNQSVYTLKIIAKRSYFYQGPPETDAVFWIVKQKLLFFTVVVLQSTKLKTISFYIFQLADPC